MLINMETLLEISQFLIQNMPGDDNSFCLRSFLSTNCLYKTRKTKLAGLDFLNHSLKDGNGLLIFCTMVSSINQKY